MIKTSPRILTDSRYTVVAFRTAGRRNAMISNGYSRKDVIEYPHNCNYLDMHCINIPSISYLLKIY